MLWEIEWYYLAGLGVGILVLILDIRADVRNAKFKKQWYENNMKYKNNLSNGKSEI